MSAISSAEIGRVASRTSNSPFSSICQARVSAGTDNCFASSAARFASPEPPSKNPCAAGDFHPGREMRRLQQVLHHREGIGARVIQALLQVGQRFRHLAGHHFLEQVQDATAIGQAQHGAHRFRGDDVARAVTDMGDGLIQQRQGIARAAFRRAGDQRQRTFLDLPLLLRGRCRQIGGEFGAVDAAQVKPLAARQHRHRNFPDLGGGEDELHMRRRFFQRLEQTIERLLGQHVHFVDDIDLVARRHRGVAHPLDDLAHIVDAGARRGVHLLHIDIAGFGNRNAGFAHAAGMDGRFRPLPVGADAVEGPGDDAGRRGLAHPAHPRQHEGMGDAAGGVLSRVINRREPPRFGPA